KEAEYYAKVRGHRNIVNMYKFSPPNRLYMEFCDTGNILQLVNRYNTAKRPIPELFIWHVAEALMRALCYLHHGIQDFEKDPKLCPDWEPLIHCDVTTHNVLLTKSPGDLYPRVLLADFGCAKFKKE
ncbi:kinase-like protein, partial [Byssothecium circinans]